MKNKLIMVVMIATLLLGGCGRKPAQPNPEEDLTGVWQGIKVAQVGIRGSYNEFDITCNDLIWAFLKEGHVMGFEQGQLIREDVYTLKDGILIIDSYEQEEMELTMLDRDRFEVSTYDEEGNRYVTEFVRVDHRFPDLFKVIDIPDPHLEQAIRTALYKEKGDIIAIDMAKLSYLDASEMGIKRLTGLEHAINLRALDLGFNKITDITPLSELSLLEELCLIFNEVSNIAPLSHLENLRELWLGGNEIEDLEPLNRLDRLEVLEVSQNRVRDIQPLANLYNLRNLNIDGNDLDLREGSVTQRIIRDHLDGGVMIAAMDRNRQPEAGDLMDDEVTPSNGEWAEQRTIKPRFDDAGPFTEGLAPVKLGNQWGYINKQGEIVIQPQFDSVYSFRDGIAIVEVKGKRGYINTKGQYIAEPTYDFAGSFGEGLAPVRVGSKMGYINETNTFVIEPIFDQAGPFYEGLAWIVQGDRQGFIDKGGNVVIDLGDSVIGLGSFQEGLAMVRTLRHYYNKEFSMDDYHRTHGFINRSGRIVIDPQFEYVHDFSEGLAAVRQDREYSKDSFRNIMHGRKWGYINPSGTFVIPMTYDDARPFSEGLAAVKQGGKWGYINATGRMVIQPRFEEAGDFQQGVAWVDLGNRRYRYIDKEGNILFSSIPYKVDLPSEGMARIEQDGKYGYIEIGK